MAGDIQLTAVSCRLQTATPPNALQRQVKIKGQVGPGIRRGTDHRFRIWIDHNLTTPAVVDGNLRDSTLAHA